MSSATNSIFAPSTMKSWMAVPSQWTCSRNAFKTGSRSRNLPPHPPRQTERPLRLLKNQFETWIAQRHQERVLQGNLNLVRPHPDEAFFRDLAARSKRVSLSDPRVDHAASCSICVDAILFSGRLLLGRHLSLARLRVPA